MLEKNQVFQKCLPIFLQIDSLTTNSNQDCIRNEFLELVSSAGLVIEKSATFNQKSISVSHFIGKGKLEEIAFIIKNYKIDLVVINHKLSATQTRNLEKYFDVRVIDKTELILDIFASRASSHIGKLQVELAQLSHLSTRLIRGWTHLERQKGGIGLRGPGETQLETDRRLIGNRIKIIKSKLKKAHKQKQLNSYARKKNRNSMVALVGYTNAGKTTLFNILTDSSKYAADQLFATLDSVTRKNINPELGSILFSDTVGFISDLPTELIDSFKATLDDLGNADLLLHVIDVSDPDYEEKVSTVENIINNLGFGHIKNIYVFNKSDKRDLKCCIKSEDEIFISAIKSEGLGDLREMINKKLFGNYYSGWVSMDPSLWSLRSKLFRMGCIVEEKISSCGVIFANVHINKEDLSKFEVKDGFEIVQEKTMLK